MNGQQELNEFNRLENLWHSIEAMELKTKKDLASETKDNIQDKPDQNIPEEKFGDTQKIIPLTQENSKLIETISEAKTIDLQKSIGIPDDTQEIEALSTEELQFLSSKIEKSPGDLFTYENPDDSQKMIFVETSEGLNVGMALPIELTNYKPDFVVTDPGESSKKDEVKKEKVPSFAEKFYFFENGTFLGITVGTSGKADVLRIMREFGSKVFKPKDTLGKSYFFDELSLAILLDDNGLVKELTVGNSFKGQTSKGLRIGDSLEKLFEIYGKPQKITPISFEWGNFVVFHKYNMVTHFRLIKNS